MQSSTMVHAMYMPVAIRRRVAAPVEPSSCFSVHCTCSPAVRCVLQAPMLEAITPLFDIVTLSEQTPLTLKGMPCERLFIIKTGTVDVLTDGAPDSGAHCAIGMYASCRVTPLNVHT